MFSVDLFNMRSVDFFSATYWLGFSIKYWFSYWFHILILHIDFTYWFSQIYLILCFVKNRQAVGLHNTHIYIIYIYIHVYLYIVNPFVCSFLYFKEHKPVWQQINIFVPCKRLFLCFVACQCIVQISIVWQFRTNCWSKW